DDAAHVDMIDLFGGDAGAGDGFLDDKGAQISSRNVGQGAAELADGGTAGGRYDDLFHKCSLLKGFSARWGSGLLGWWVDLFPNPQRGLWMKGGGGGYTSPCRCLASRALSTFGVTNWDTSWW